jgi:hypothetical protein
VAQTVPTGGLALAFTFGTTPTFSVESGSNSSGLLTVLGGSGSGLTSPPAAVVVDLPTGYAASPEAPGATVGLALFESIAGSGETTSAAILTAPLVAADPAKYAADPAAQACAGGTPTTVWTLSTTIVALAYSLPIFVGHPASNRQGLELRFCPPPLNGADGKPLATPPVPISTLLLALTPLSQPSAAGSYTSSAFVTPENASGAPNPQATVETRFLLTIPHTLTAKGRYDKKTGDAIVTGRVTNLGNPQARALVEYSTATQSSSGAITSISETTKHVRATAAGTYTIRMRISKTTLFLVDAAGSTGACQGASTAPHGCVSETVEGTAEHLVRVVPR